MKIPNILNMKESPDLSTLNPNENQINYDPENKKSIEINPLKNSSNFGTH